MEATSFSRMLRPLGGGRPALPSNLTIRPGRLTVIAGLEHVASETVIRALEQRNTGVTTVWLRLDSLDSEPSCLMESLLRAATHAHDTAGRQTPAIDPSFDVDSNRSVGRRLASAIDDTSVVVLEDEQPTRRRGAAVHDALQEYLRRAGDTASAVYLCHGGIHRDIGQITSTVFDGNPLPDVFAGLIESGHLGNAASLSRLSAIAALGDAVINDIIDAAELRDPELFAYLIGAKVRRRTLLHRINSRLLPRLTPAELQALTTATRIGYWHPSLSDRASPAPMTLRPWMVQLERDWWWLRPMWRPSLAGVLDPAQRAGRRFSIDYRPLERITRRAATRPVATAPKVAARAAAPRTELPPASPSTNVPSTEPAERPSADPRSAEPPTTRRATSVGAGSPLTSDRPSPVVDDAPNDEPLTQLEVRMFGVFDVNIDGVSVPRWHGRLGRSILAHLLLQQQHCLARDRLVEIFWPDAEPGCAQNRLRVAVSSLRRSLRAASDHQVIEFVDGNYRIARTCEVGIDVDEFEQRARDGRRAEAQNRPNEAITAYRRAIECYHGELLADMPYEDWTLLPREALRVAYLECLANASSLHLRRDDHSEVMSLAWDILAEDPAREDAHRLIMRCHAAKGDVHQVQRQFDLCRRELMSLLGVEPAPATVELLRSLDSPT